MFVYAVEDQMNKQHALIKQLDKGGAVVKQLDQKETQGPSGRAVTGSLPVARHLPAFY
ncbi:hypothetical protein WUBG_10331 [Wuchereria bancrofti]|uniref:Uncharacterized protein n=1 Tax=Wuchereria bancrofti TaxID=6293 RepID=J9E9D7_WUCBA|nr:hypothetical protein WUBG_10331 [Wuchereria bancrofti]